MEHANSNRSPGKEAVDTDLKSIFPPGPTACISWLNLGHSDASSDVEFGERHLDSLESVCVCVWLQFLCSHHLDPTLFVVLLILRMTRLIALTHVSVTGFRYTPRTTSIIRSWKMSMSTSTQLDLGGLVSRIKGDVILPDHETYSISIARWSKLAERQAAAVVFARDEHDVAATIEFAREQKLELAVKGTAKISHSQTEAC